MTGSFSHSRPSTSKPESRRRQPKGSAMLYTVRREEGVGSVSAGIGSGIPRSGWSRGEHCEARTPPCVHILPAPQLLSSLRRVTWLAGLISDTMRWLSANAWQHSITTSRWSRTDQATTHHKHKTHTHTRETRREKASERVACNSSDTSRACPTLCLGTHSGRLCNFCARRQKAARP